MEWNGMEGNSNAADSNNSEFEKQCTICVATFIFTTSRIDKIHIEAVHKEKKPSEYEVCNQTLHFVGMDKT